MDVIAALALCRFLRDAAALLLWGGALYLAVIVPADLRPVLSSRWRPLGLACAFKLAAALAALLPVQAAALGTGWGDAIAPDVLHSLLVDTGIGTAWIAQVTATALLLLGVGVVPPRWRDPAVAVTAAGVLAALTLTGHASMREGWAGLFQRGCDLLHLLAGGFWLGALPPLLSTLRMPAAPTTQRGAVVALRRFSSAGHVAVALVLATGAANTALVLGHLPLDWTSPYQALLALKIGLVAVMTGLALANRYIVVPRLAAEGPVMLRQLRRLTLAEIGLGLGAVALVALFGLLEPR